MAKRITISLPHDLSEAEVKSRLVGAIAEARAKHPEMMRAAQESWSGNCMEFRGSALGQTITGRVEIQPRTVLISLDLPFMLAMLANRLRPQIEAEARKLLSRTTSTARVK